MAKDPLKAQLQDAQSKAEKAQAEVDRLKAEQQKNPTVEGRAAIRDAMMRLGPVLDEYAELQRAVSRMAGGKQYGVEA